MSFLILLGYQLMQFRPQTAEVPMEDPEEAAQQQEVTNEQLCKRMGIKMRRLGFPVDSPASRLFPLGPLGPPGPSEALAVTNLPLAVLGSGLCGAGTRPAMGYLELGGVPQA